MAVGFEERVTQKTKMRETKEANTMHCSATNHSYPLPYGPHKRSPTKNHFKDHTHILKTYKLVST